MVQDPVCNMSISSREAYAVRTVDNVRIYFCSAACVKQFDAAPQRYYPLLGGVATPTATGSTASQILPSSFAFDSRMLRLPLLFGLLAVLGMLGFYLGIITLAQSWGHAIQQLVEDHWFIAAITIGFGTQVTLYSYLRARHTPTASGGVAISTGTSTTAMLACCAHHLADVLPIAGAAGAAVFLNTYKIPLFWLGIGMNLAGIIYMARKIHQQRAMQCHVSTRSREHTAREEEEQRLATHSTPRSEKECVLPTLLEQILMIAQLVS